MAKAKKSSRLLSLFLVLAMVLSLIPAMALSAIAEETTVAAPTVTVRMNYVSSSDLYDVSVGDTQYPYAYYRVRLESGTEGATYKYFVTNNEETAKTVDAAYVAENGKDYSVGEDGTLPVINTPDNMAPFAGGKVYLFAVAQKDGKTSDVSKVELNFDKYSDNGINAATATMYWNGAEVKSLSDDEFYVVAGKDLTIKVRDLYNKQFFGDNFKVLYKFGDGEYAELTDETPSSANGTYTITIPGSSIAKAGEYKFYTLAQATDSVGGKITREATYKLKVVDSADVAATLTAAGSDKMELKEYELYYLSSYIDAKKINNYTLTVNKDLDLAPYGNNPAVASGYNMTLDLNGHAIAASPWDIRVTGDNTVLTVKDSSEAKTGKLTSSALYMFRVENGGKLVMESGNIESPFADVRSNGNVTVTGGNFSKEIIYFTNGDNRTVKVTGGTANYSEKTAIFDFNDLGSGDNVEIGGDFKGTSTGYVISASNLGNSSGAVKISGGTYVSEGKTIDAAGRITEVTGGTFKCTTDNATIAFANYAQIKTPEGKALLYDKEKGYFCLQTPPEAKDSGSIAVTPTGGTETTYTSVQQAFDAVKDNGGTIKLNADSSLTDKLYGLTLNADTVIDLNGHTLTIAPVVSGSMNGAINQNGGALTVKSSADGGKLVLNAFSGITLGMGCTGFTLESGEISGANYGISAVNSDVVNFRGDITVKGGKISASERSIAYAGFMYYYFVSMGASIKICGDAELEGTLHASGANTVTITDNAKVSNANGAAVNLENIAGDVEISKNAKLLSTGVAEDAPLFVSANVNNIIIKDNAQIESTQNVAPAINVGVSSNITISDNARLAGTKAVGYNVTDPTSSTNPKITINGGYYKWTDMPFGSATLVQYKADPEYTQAWVDDFNAKNGTKLAYAENDANAYYILSATPETEGDAAGYYGIVPRKDFLSIKHIGKDGSEYSTKNDDGTPFVFSYQYFDDLVNALRGAEETVKQTDKYTATSLAALQTAIDNAKTVVTVNEDGTFASASSVASQAEIDIFYDAIMKAVGALKGQSEFDPSNLADGIYNVSVMIYANGSTNVSMANGSIQPEAELHVKDGKYTLYAKFKPMYLFNMWGHLVGLETFSGESRSAATTGKAEVVPTYNYYTSDSTSSNIIVCTKDHEHGKEYNADGTPTCYPLTFMVPLYYHSASDNRHLVQVQVDIMDNLGVGKQRADLTIQWDTLQAISIDPTLKLDEDNVTVIAGGDSASVTAKLLAGADQTATPIAVKSADEKIATASVKDGVITIDPVAAGTTTVTVSTTVTSEGAAAVELSKTITVTVAPKGSKAMTVASEAKDGAETATISGSTIITGSDRIAVDDKAVTIDATAENAENVKSASVTISADAGKALAAEGKPVVIKTDAGEITLDAKDIANGAKISIKKLDSLKGVIAKDGSKVDFTADTDVAYAVTAPGTVTVKVPFAGERGYAYTVNRANKLDGRSNLSIDAGTASFEAKTGTYALSENEFELADPAPAYKFVDVPSDIYYHTPVYWAVDNEITNGTDATHFSPDLICTRAQLVTFLWRYAGSPEPTSTETPFTDVDVNSWYGKAVLWATEKGIVKGMTPTTFEPFTNVNRAQTITMIYRYEGSPAVEKTGTFTDVPSDIYYADAVAWGVANKIVQGMTPTTFEPDTECARAQAVTFLYRLANA